MDIINGIPFLKRSLARKLPSHGWKSMVSPVIRCHPQRNSNSSDLGVQKPQTRNNPQLYPIHSEKNGWYCSQYIAVWLMIPLNGNPLVKKGLEPTLKWGIDRGLGEFRLTHGARDVTMEWPCTGIDVDWELKLIWGSNYPWCRNCMKLPQPIGWSFPLKHMKNTMFLYVFHGVLLIVGKL